MIDRQRRNRKLKWNETKSKKLLANEAKNKIHCDYGIADGFPFRYSDSHSISITYELRASQVISAWRDVPRANLGKYRIKIQWNISERVKDLPDAGQLVVFCVCFSLHFVIAYLHVFPLERCVAIVVVLLTSSSFSRCEKPRRVTLLPI